jgi:transporter family protein
MRILNALKAKWFWYCVLALVGWGGWALLLKLGSMEIPAETAQFLSTLGLVPVGVGLLVAQGFKLEKNPAAIFCSVLSGVITVAGILALLAAYRVGGNTAIVAVTTALYPMVTIVLAVLILRERLTRIQLAGIGLAMIAIVIFSL